MPPKRVVLAVHVVEEEDSGSDIDGHYQHEEQSLFLQWFDNRELLKTKFQQTLDTDLDIIITTFEKQIQERRRHVKRGVNNRSPAPVDTRTQSRDIDTFAPPRRPSGPGGGELLVPAGGGADTDDDDAGADSGGGSYSDSDSYSDSGSDGNRPPPPPPPPARPFRAPIPVVDGKPFLPKRNQQPRGGGGDRVPGLNRNPTPPPPPPKHMTKNPRYPSDDDDDAPPRTQLPPRFGCDGADNRRTADDDAAEQRDRLMAVLNTQLRVYPFMVEPKNVETFSLDRLRKHVERNAFEVQTYYNARFIKISFLGFLFLIQLGLRSVLDINVQNFWTFQKTMLRDYEMCFGEIADLWRPAKASSPWWHLAQITIMYTGIFVIHEVLLKRGGVDIIQTICAMASVDMNSVPMFESRAWKAATGSATPA
jgi:hypothetical protein